MSTSAPNPEPSSEYRRGDGTLIRVLRVAPDGVVTYNFKAGRLSGTYYCDLPAFQSWTLTPLPKGSVGQCTKHQAIQYPPTK